MDGRTIGWRRLLGWALLGLLGASLGAAAEARAQGPVAAADSTDYTDFNLDQLMTMDVVYGAASYDQKIFGIKVS